MRHLALLVVLTACNATPTPAPPPATSPPALSPPEPAPVATTPAVEPAREPGIAWPTPRWPSPPPATPSAELAALRALLPPHHDLATVRASTVGGTDPITPDGLDGSRARADLNRDGVEDLVLIAERDPTWTSYGAPCEPESRGCTLEYGARTLVVFHGVAGGGLERVLTVADLVLDASYGGALGDPLQSFRVGHDTIGLSFEGGMGVETWSKAYTIGYRDGDYVFLAHGSGYALEDGGHARTTYGLVSGTGAHVEIDADGKEAKDPFEFAPRVVRVRDFVSDAQLTEGVVP